MRGSEYALYELSLKILAALPAIAIIALLALVAFRLLLISEKGPTMLKKWGVRLEKRRPGLRAAIALTKLVRNLATTLLVFGLARATLERLTQGERDPFAIVKATGDLLWRVLGG